ncbi:integrase catalytic domain-containing protein [Variovorax sp. HJSM1_2]|uniref:integrase catalytic domain-containing protein n=1 Tax=Variovorax sp. HJSM1_2 TaxID=3366263 RepID=UPI003BED30D4
MNEPDFHPIQYSGLTAGLVLRVGETSDRFLRLTHVFSRAVYGMWVSTAAQARYARRPIPIPLPELKELIDTPGSTWGKIHLPPGLIQPVEESSRAIELDSSWLLIEPLITAFESESNLSRSRFNTLICERADSTSTSWLNLTRLVKRFYYFGRIRFALLPLYPGVKPGGKSPTAVCPDGEGNTPLTRRRGRQPLLAEELGSNNFVVGEDDIADMIESYKAELRKGATFITSVYPKYLQKAFKERHEKVFDEYVKKKRPVPVTERQFRYYVSTHVKLSADLSVNARIYKKNSGYLASVRASGPGEIYEIDATVGRLFLVSDADPPVQVGKPTIYLIIDRWSRFVVAVYLSLRPPSYEEVRHALLIAFTSRETRFRELGINIDDTRWPVGRMPPVICSDRGSEFLSDAFENAVVNDLRIDHTVLPPLCPDGKAIVERSIREFKRRMTSMRIKGVYADRPLDPQTKRIARRAEAAAVHSLSDAYRVIVEIIDAHNNSPHTSLRRMRMLTQAGVHPTPKEAYLWGIKNLTGVRLAPLTDEDYQRMLLSTDQASGSQGLLRYRGRAYQPVNALAHTLASSWAKRARAVQIRLDKTMPMEIFVVTARREWAKFHITAGAARELFGISLDEEEALSTQTARFWAQAENDSLIERVTAKETKRGPRKRPTGTPEKLDKRGLQNARELETENIKQALLGKQKQPPKPKKPSDVSAQSSWEKLEEQERLDQLETIRKHRSQS